MCATTRRSMSPRTGRSRSLGIPSFSPGQFCFGYNDGQNGLELRSHATGEGSQHRPRCRLRGVWTGDARPSCLPVHAKSPPFRGIANCPGEKYTQWNDLFDQSSAWTYDSFQNRTFLERVIPRLELPSASATSVFEYGCGTGPAACFLAARGFQVDAIDLIPEAIRLARRMARERGVRVAFSMADVCALASEPVTRRYDLVLDSYCLQSIVTDEDRGAVFSAVRARLKPSGYYILSLIHI